MKLPKTAAGIGSVRSGESAGRTLSVIIPACNEASTIGRVMDEVRKLVPDEIIVIANGCKDQTEKTARRRGALTFVFQEPLGTDVGRAIGAYAAGGDVMLFVDADFVIPRDDLQPFVHAVRNGCDIAVNRLDHHLWLRHPVGPVTRMKCKLNSLLGRADLSNSSLIHVPFAMNRRALELIGWQHLLCPPKAYALALLLGLKVEPVHCVEVDRLNRYRPEKHNRAGEAYSPATMQIIGDHLEAMKLIEEYPKKGRKGTYEGQRGR